jgi:exodeoxyribonuclease VII large subunit
MLRQRSQLIDDLHRRLEQNLVHNFKIAKYQSNSLSTRINSLNPKLVLKRGYAIIRQEHGIISTLKEIKTARPALIEFQDGIADVQITGKRK